jgi:cold shock CspA family protein
MAKGRLRAWHPERGFGFIKADSPPRHDPNLRRPDAPDVFVHVSQITQGAPYHRARVEFEVASDRNQRPHAIDVRVLSDAEKPS